MSEQANEGTVQMEPTEPATPMPYVRPPRPLYQELAGLVMAVENCRKSGNTEWLDKHTDRLNELVGEHMPSGSEFDSGTTLDLVDSRSERLLFRTSFHHMDEWGYYDGWTHHTVAVSASLLFGIDVKVGGRNRNGIKDHIHEVFDLALKEMIS